MFRKLLLLSATFISINLFAADAQAMQLNVSLDDDIALNQDKLIFNYDIYYDVLGASQKHMANKFSGIDAKIVPVFLERLKAAFSDIQPMNSIDGKYSQFTLGYIKNGAEVYPASCQRILARPVTTILIGENGCKIS